MKNKQNFSLLFLILQLGFLLFCFGCSEQYRLSPEDPNLISSIKSIVLASNRLNEAERSFVNGEKPNASMYRVDWLYTYCYNWELENGTQIYVKHPGISTLDELDNDSVFITIIRPQEKALAPNVLSVIREATISKVKLTKKEKSLIKNENPTWRSYYTGTKAGTHFWYWYLGLWSDRSVDVEYKGDLERLDPNNIKVTLVNVKAVKNKILYGKNYINKETDDNIKFTDKATAVFTWATNNYAPWEKNESYEFTFDIHRDEPNLIKLYYFGPVDMKFFPYNELRISESGEEIFFVEKTSGKSGTFKLIK